ncbi:MAG TPA: hypothetical protein PLG17_12655, partial [Thermodesulfobacteriota bacterium]|nr:hypothetical protein [Thermodesulfobacteriota bacterium]
MTAPLLEYLRMFNAKERFFLVGYALDNPCFALGEKFREDVGVALGLEVPADAFCAMDYHLDWLYASLKLNADEGKIKVYPNNDDIKAQQEDVDLLIAFQNNDVYHIIIIEAKCATGWTSSQMRSKAGRLKKIFGEEHAKGVKPHFVFLSPKKPNVRRLEEDLEKSEKWPPWMKIGEHEVNWLQLNPPKGHCLRSVSRCEKVDTGKKPKPCANGHYWTM